MSPPTDRRSAPSGVLDPPIRGGSRPYGSQWSDPLDDFWRDDDPLDPDARSPVRPAPGGPSARRRPRGRSVIPARRWPGRILVAVNLMVAMMLIAAGTVYGYVHWRFGQIHKIVIPSITGSTAAPGAPMTILVVGSDSRAGDKGSDAKQFGSASLVAGQRSDTIMLIHVDPASTSATLMSIPRDLWVPIAGKSYSQRINTTFDTGPDLLVKTIEQNLAINIDHYVEVNFQSFRDVVNAVGGVKEYFPTPARDAYSLLNVPSPGCYTMSGDQALSFVRARHYEYKVNGRWVSEAESDLARIRRQQSFIKKTIAKAQGSGLTNPLELNRIISGVTNNLTLDSGFSQNLMLTLAKRFRNISPGSLPAATLPTTPAVVGGADVLFLQQPQAQLAITDFLNPPHPATSSTTNQTSTTVSSVLPSSVKVEVLNGTGRSGEAAKAGSDLSRQGFAFTSSRSAPNFSYTTSEIHYLPGNEAKAQLLAKAVQGAIQLQADPSLQGVDVQLITGQSYLGINQLPATGHPTTPTSGAATGAPDTTAVTTYELPGTPPGFVPPAC